MIRRTVAFEADDVAAGLVWMNDTYIDSVLGDADLRMCDVAGRLKTREKPPFEIAVWLLPGLPPVLDGAARRVFQEFLEHAHAALLAFGHDLRGIKRSKQCESSLGASEEHVQAAMAVGLIDGAKILVKNPFGRFAVYCRDKDDVTLIALYVFKVLHKKGLKRPVPMLAVGLDFRIRCGQFVHQRLDQLALSLIDGNNADGSIDPLSHMRGGFRDDRPRLFRIAALARFVATSGNLLAGNSEIGVVEKWARIDEEPVVIELSVGISDQRLMTRAVMDPQHSHWPPTTPTQFKNRLFRRVFDFFVVPAFRRYKKVARRQLFGIAHHHRLRAADQRAKRVLGAHLRCFVDNEQVEAMFAGLEILRNRHRAHHNAGLISANSRACVAEQTTQRDARLLQACLMIEHLVVGIVARRLRALADGNGPAENLRGHEAAVQRKDFLVEFLKPLANLF